MLYIYSTYTLLVKIFQFYKTNFDTAIGVESKPSSVPSLMFINTLMIETCRKTPQTQ